MKKVFLSCMFITLISFSLTSCKSSQRMTEVQLFFGLSIPGGGQVSPAEWDQFVGTRAALVFPAGFSVIAVQGKWRDPETGQLISEESRQLIAFVKKDRSLSKRIDSLRGAYVSLFRQQSVLRVDHKAKVSF